jgi:hypothetical protein
MNQLQHLALPLLSGRSLSFLLEQALNPKPLPPWQRRFPSLMLHGGVWLLLCSLLLVLFQRPWFAVVIILAFQYLLVMVNHAKFVTLREAFIFQDFEYFTDAIKHPRLYLPFFGITRTLAAAIGFITAFYLGVWLETPLTESLGLIAFIATWASLVSVGLILTSIGNRFCPKAHYQPNQDLIELGQAAFFLQYWQDEKINAVDLQQTTFVDLPTSLDNHSKLSDIVVVQSESFFDPRPLYPQIKATVLQHFDQLKAESYQQGRVQVPAWGANTVRTECGFLTGLSPEKMGIHQFNPYRLLAKQSIANLASYLKQLGYKTVCIHPYPVSFYQRNQVYPRMGFDQFIDIQAFSDEQKCGQYTGDLAVTDKIIATLKASDDQPVFIFVITMENHGPLHLEKPESGDTEKFYHQTPDNKAQDLTVYLRHLHNADLMVKRLRDIFLERDSHLKKEGTLCWYGDHVPIMAEVYQQLGEPDGLTDYLIWNTRTAGSDRHPNQDAQPLAINELAMQLLKAAHLPCKAATD